MDRKQEEDREFQKRRVQEQNENRIDQLISTVENYTRTERHIEENSDIGDPKRLKHAEGIQSERKSEIEHLRDNIVYGDACSDDNLANLKENYEDTKEYLDHYGSKMNKEDLKNIEEKQKNRLNSLNEMK